jgi:hypothetical protein
MTTKEIKQYLSAIGKKGGSVKGKSKRRKNSFDSKSARAALKIRWDKYRKLHKRRGK